jgi:hypothetical protein
MGLDFKLGPMIGENRQLVTNEEPVEFEKSPLEVHICKNKKNTDHFR